MNLKIALLTGTAALSVATASSADTYRLLHSWDKTTEPGTAYIVDNFAPRIGEAIEGADILSFGPESVPSFEQYEPLQAGAFDFLYTHTAYHFGTTRGAFFADAIDGNAAERREGGVWDAIDAHYEGLGAKLIAMVTVPGGFHIQMSEPLEDGRLTGRTVRGTNVYGSVVEALDGSIVVLPIGEVYTALERGVVDGAASPIIGSTALGWNEQAKYMVRPRFGTSTTYLFMNLDRFSELGPDEQEALLDLGRETEEGAEALMVELIDGEETDLVAAGSEAMEMTPDVRDDLGQIWADGLFAISSETDPEAASALRETARAAGLAE